MSTFNKSLDKRCSPYCNCPKCAKAWMMDETVMPDGRPLVAWKNEIELLRAQVETSHNRMKEAQHLAKLAGIVNVYREQNPNNLEIVLRITLDRIMSAKSRDPLDSALID